MEREKQGDIPVAYVSAGNMLFPIKKLEPYRLPQARYIAGWLLEHFRGEVFHLTRRDHALMGSWTEPTAAEYRIVSAVPPVGRTGAVLSIGSRRIGFVGLDTPESDRMADPGYRADWCRDQAETIAQFRKAHSVWAVAGLSGMGLEIDRVIADNLPGLDLLLGLHSEKMAVRTELIRNVLMTHVTASGKYLARIDLTLRQPMPGAVDMSRFENAEERQRIIDENADLQRKIDAQMELGVSPGEGVVKILEQRMERNKKKLADMESAAGSFAYLHRGIPLDETIEPDPKAVSEKNRLIARINEINRNAPDSLLVQEENIQYAGWAACRKCHDTQFRFVENHKHSKAWETLVTDKRDADVDCIGCHAAAFGEPGGIFHVRQLEPFHDVQCESCHGPGKAHADDPSVKPFLRVTADTCLKCHTRDQSDEVIETRLVELFHCPAQN